MAKITEEDIVEFLEDKIEQLQKELRKTKAVLETLKGTHEIEEVKLKKKEKKIIKSTMAQAEKADKKDKARKSPDKSSTKTKKTAPVQISLEDKIKTALAQGPGFREDIVSQIHNGEPNVDLKKLNKAVANKLSVLLKDKKILGAKEGQKYKYSSIEAQVQ